MAKAAARIEGVCEIRPVRIGIAFSPTIEKLRSAILGATKCWGGVYFPFLDATNPERSLKIAAALDVDAIWPLDTHPESIALSREAGYFWRRFGDEGPFDSPDDTIPSSPISPEWAISESGSGPFSLPEWDAEDPLATVFAAWFGEYESSESISSLFRSKASIAHLNTTERIPSGVINFHSPITTTALGITYRGVDNRAGIMEVNPDNPADIVHFWNFRASGIRIFPWVDSESARLIGPFESWLSRVAPSVPRWRSGDGSDEKRVISLWNMPELPGFLQQALQDYQFHIEDNLLYGGWRGNNSLSTPFSRTFSSQGEPSGGIFSVPLPPGPPATYSTKGKAGIVAAQVTIYSEHNFPPSVVAAVPYTRAYSRIVDTMRNFPGNFERITHDGRAIATSADSHEVEIEAVYSLPLFQKIFEDTTWKSRHSQGGRLVSRIIELLGGPQNYPGNQPAIRCVLDDAAKSTQGKVLPALIQSAKNRKGKWPGRLTFNAADYPKNVVYYLLNRKLLQPFLKVCCPHCSMNYLLRPGDLGYDMECEICTERFPLGLALGLAPGARNEWAYKLTGNISADRIAEIMPVAAVLSVMTDTLGGGKSGLPYIFGLIVEEGEWKCEIDILLMADWEERPIVVIGEVKSYRDSIDRNDLDNLLRVQDFMRSQGFECLILAATLREELTEAEIADLRDMCGNIATAREGNRIYPLLPIIFTGADLSIPRDDDAYPARWGSHFDLLEFAEDSCRKNLGLLDVRSTRSEGSPSEWSVSWE